MEIFTLKNNKAQNIFSKIQNQTFFAISGLQFCIL